MNILNFRRSGWVGSIGTASAALLFAAVTLHGEGRQEEKKAPPAKGREATPPASRPAPDRGGRGQGAPDRGGRGGQTAREAPDRGGRGGQAAGTPDRGGRGSQVAETRLIGAVAGAGGERGGQRRSGCARRSISAKRATRDADGPVRDARRRANGYRSQEGERSSGRQGRPHRERQRDSPTAKRRGARRARAAWDIHHGPGDREPYGRSVRIVR